MDRFAGRPEAGRRFGFFTRASRSRFGETAFFFFGLPGFAGRAFGGFPFFGGLAFGFGLFFGELFFLGFAFRFGFFLCEAFFFRPVFRFRSFFGEAFFFAFAFGFGFFLREFFFFGFAFRFRFFFGESFFFGFAFFGRFLFFFEPLQAGGFAGGAEGEDAAGRADAGRPVVAGAREADRLGRALGGLFGGRILQLWQMPWAVSTSVAISCAQPGSVAGEPTLTFVKQPLAAVQAGRPYRSSKTPRSCSAVGSS